MARALVLWLILTVLAGASGARANEGPLKTQENPKTLEALLGELEALLKASKTPGLSLALVTTDGVVFTGGFGQANVARGLAVDADTLFRIGSTSKAFVALAALKLQAEGRLDFNATLASLAPEIEFVNRWEATDPVRVIHLLEHTTGFDDLQLRDYANNDARPNNLLEALAYTPWSRESRWRPGTRYAYCNSGSPIVAAIIEKITGDVFEDYVQREFFVPIGMRSATYFQPASDANAALMYANDGFTPFDYWHISVRPAGAINASARDMAAYLSFLLHRGRAGETVLIDEAEMQRMERPRSSTAARAGLRQGYGLYNQTSNDADGRLWQGHGGGVQGGRCDLSYLPEAGVGYALMINTSDDALLGRVSRLVRGFLTQALPKPEAPPVVPLPAETAARYEGFYLPVNPRVKLWGIASRVGSVRKLRVVDGGIRFEPLIGSSPAFVGVTDTLLRRSHQIEPAMVLLTPTEKDAAHLVIQGESFQRVPAVVALAPLGLFLGACLAMASTVIYSPVWMIRGAFGKLALREHLGLRLWPLAATLALGCFLFLAANLANDPRVFQNYGTLTGRSFALAASGIVATVCAWIGAVNVWRTPRLAPSRWLQLHSRSALSVLALLTLYLVVAGAMPLLSWR